MYIPIFFDVNKKTIKILNKNISLYFQTDT